MARAIADDLGPAAAPAVLLDDLLFGELDRIPLIGPYVINDDVINDALMRIHTITKALLGFTRLQIEPAIAALAVLVSELVGRIEVES